MRIRAGALSLFIAAGALAPAVVPASSACAAEAEPRAALIVDTGRGKPLEMCVALGEPKVTGIELIELASDQYDLQYRLGYGGRGVCQLANVPKETPSEECFEDRDSFWGYWRGDGSGGWEWSGSGGGGTVVEDGDVEGWAYGTGRDGDTHQEPGPRSNGDPYTFESVCLPIDEPAEEEGNKEGEPADEKEEGSKAGGGGFGNLPNVGNQPKAEKTPSPVVTPEPEPDNRLLDSAPDISELELAATPSAPPTELPAGATSARSDAESQLPVGGALALVATIAMALIAVVLIRKRTPASPEE